MTLTEVEKYMQAAANSWMEETFRKNGLAPLTLLDGPPQVGDDEYSFGLYLSAPTQELFRMDGNTLMVSMTADCLISLQEVDAPLGARYASAFLEWILSTGFQISVMPTMAIVERVDAGDPYNGFTAGLELAIDYMTDDMAGMAI